MKAHHLEGVWTYVTYEVCGVRRQPESLAKLANLVLLGWEYVPGWDGLWAVVIFGYDGNKWTDQQIKSACRKGILGDDKVDEPSACDIYIYAGGGFRVALEKSPNEIDWQQFCDGAPQIPMNLGIFALNQDRLTLCMGFEGRPRPSRFSSTERPHQDLGELTREPRTES